MTVLQVFFGNLIFALTARTLSGNRLKSLRKMTISVMGRLKLIWPNRTVYSQLINFPSISRYFTEFCGILIGQ